MSNSVCLLMVLAAQCFLPLPLLAAPPVPANVGREDQWLCAPGCWCSHDGLSAECAGVTPDPSTLPPEVVSLSLMAHQLRQVHNDTFAALPGLQDLDLSDGRISEVTVDAFSSLPRLRSLSLSNNELTFLPADVFSSNPALEVLDLRSNPLVLPSIGPFLRSPSLQELSLVACSLRRFSPDSFTQLPSLLSLDLTFNSFSQLTSEAVEPFMNLNWLSVDAGALSEEALAFLQTKGVLVDVFELVNTTAEEDLLPEDRDDAGGAIYLGFLDKEYHYDEDATGGDHAVVQSMLAADESERQRVDDQPQTGASASEVPRRWVRHPSWKLVLFATLMGSTICVTSALAYWATVLVIRRRSAARAAQGPRDTLDRAFRQVASLPAYQQLKRQPAKPKPSSGSGGSQGYSRLYDEEEAPASLPPRAAQPEPCTCLSCSEPVPTQPCIRFYERPASVHGAVPSQFYTLYPTHKQ